MKKVRKGKKMLIMMLIAIVVIIAAVFIIRGIVKNVSKKPEEPAEPKEEVITLPETKTYSGMDVQNVYMEYLKDNNETMITMRITNTTDETVKDEKFNAILIGPDDNVLATLPTGTNVDLGIGDQCEISVVYKGDLTSTKQIKLERIDK